MLETTCCTHAPIPKTPSSSSSNLKAPHRVRHNHLQNSAGCCCLYDYIPSLPKPNFPGPSLPGHICPSPSLPRPKFARSQICLDPSLPRPNLPRPIFAQAKFAQSQVCPKRSICVKKSTKLSNFYGLRHRNFKFLRHFCHNQLTTKQLLKKKLI